MLVTSDGRQVKYTPRMRGIIHPDERLSTAISLRTMYRFYLRHGMSRMAARAGARHVRLGIACDSKLTIFSD